MESDGILSWQMNAVQTTPFNKSTLRTFPRYANGHQQYPSDPTQFRTRPCRDSHISSSAPPPPSTLTSSCQRLCWSHMVSNNHAVRPRTRLQSRVTRLDSIPRAFRASALAYCPCVPDNYPPRMEGVPGCHAWAPQLLMRWRFVSSSTVARSRFILRTDRLRP
jgi:hypothetical protein